MSTPQFENLLVPPCFAVFLANGWTSDVHISVSRAGIHYDVSTFGRIPLAGQPPEAWSPVPATGLPPGQTAVLFLSSDPRANFNFSPLDPEAFRPPGIPMTCPVPPAVNESTTVSGGGYNRPVGGRGRAFHIQTDLPVTAYDVLPFGGRASVLAGATLLLPTSAWGTNYLGIVPMRGAAPASQQWAQIIAQKDNTIVTVLPNVALPGDFDLDPAPAGMATTYSLDAGEFIQWQDTGEMSSTVISSNQPVAFIGGHSRPYYGGPSDVIHQQIPPIQSLGHEYGVAAYATRRPDGARELIPYRLVGAVNGTLLTYDYGSSGPSTINAGQVVDINISTDFAVRSQDKDHPFFLGQHMTSADSTGCAPYDDAGNPAPGCRALGDPEFVAVPPVAQFLTKYLFFTDPTYRTTNLVFTRVADASGFHDVNLDCLGPVTGWRPIGIDGKFETATVDLVRDGVKNGSCDNGQHTASSSAPFGLVVWGLDLWVSYAYPAGGHYAPKNQVVLEPKPPH